MFKACFGHPPQRCYKRTSRGEIAQSGISNICGNLRQSQTCIRRTINNRASKASTECTHMCTPWMQRRDRLKCSPSGCTQRRCNCVCLSCPRGGWWVGFKNVKLERLTATRQTKLSSEKLKHGYGNISKMTGNTRSLLHKTQERGINALTPVFLVLYSRVSMLRMTEVDFLMM